MDSAYRAALLSRPSEALGRRLLPFSLGHSYLLEALGSPLVCGGGVSEDDIVVAAWVCSRTYQDALSSIRRMDMEPACRAWGEAVGASVDWESEGEAIADHMSKYAVAPRRWQSEKSKGPRAPWQLSVATAMMMHAGVPEQEAWDKPLSESLCMYAAIGDHLGDEGLMTDSEAAVAERVEATHGQG